MSIPNSIDELKKHYSILPCPCCGTEPKFTSVLGIYCTKCWLNMPFAHRSAPHSLIKAWNKRFESK